MATNTDLNTTSEVIGSFLSAELGRTSSVEVTTEEISDRLSLPADEVNEVMQRMVDDETVPLTGERGDWTVAR